MKIKYEFITGEVQEVIVPDEFIKVVMEIERQVYNNYYKKRIRHISYEKMEDYGFQFRSNDIEVVENVEENFLRERIFVMDNYAKIQELVTKAKAGEDTALEELLKTFKALISSQAVAISAKGYDLDDLIQVGTIALCKAVHGYDITKGNFPCYVAIAIKNNLEGLIYMGRDTDAKNSVSKLQRS